MIENVEIDYVKAGTIASHEDARLDLYASMRERLSEIYQEVEGGELVFGRSVKIVFPKEEKGENDN